MFVETVPLFELFVKIFVWQYSAPTLATIVNKTGAVPFSFPIKSMVDLFKMVSEILPKFIAYAVVLCVTFLTHENGFYQMSFTEE